MAPLVREQTVKAVLTIVTKLSDRIINGELLKHLAKTSNDEQPGIRTNTTICLGKIARNIGATVRISYGSMAIAYADRLLDEAKSTCRSFFTIAAGSIRACTKRSITCAGGDFRPFQ